MQGHGKGILEALSCSVRLDSVEARATWKMMQQRQEKVVGELDPGIGWGHMVTNDSHGECCWDGVEVSDSDHK